MIDVYEAWAPILTWWKVWQKRRRLNLSRVASRSRVARRVLGKRRRGFDRSWSRIFGGGR